MGLQRHHANLPIPQFLSLQVLSLGIQHQLWSPLPLLIFTAKITLQAEFNSLATMTKHVHFIVYVNAHTYTTMASSCLDHSIEPLMYLSYLYKFDLMEVLMEVQHLQKDNKNVLAKCSFLINISSSGQPNFNMLLLHKIGKRSSIQKRSVLRYYLSSGYLVSPRRKSCCKRCVHILYSLMRNYFKLFGTWPWSIVYLMFLEMILFPTHILSICKLHSMCLVQCGEKG